MKIILEYVLFAIAVILFVPVGIVFVFVVFVFYLVLFIVSVLLAVVSVIVGASQKSQASARSEFAKFDNYHSGGSSMATKPTPKPYK